MHEEHGRVHYSSSGAIFEGSSIDYAYPDAGIRLAQFLDPDGGVSQIERDWFDARGNLLRAEGAYAPDFSTWTTTLTRNYDCFNSK